MVVMPMTPVSIANADDNNLSGDLFLNVTEIAMEAADASKQHAVIIFIGAQ